MRVQYYSRLISFILVIGFGLRAKSDENNHVTTCDLNDSRALQGFMAALQNPPDNWEIKNSSFVNCCEWEGVTCELTGLEGQRRVVKLELPRKRLNGKLSDSLGSLDQLRTLNLSENFLAGSLPISIFDNLSNLKVLDLSFNDFTGHVPGFASLSSIQHLDMSQNLLDGSLPGHICGIGDDNDDDSSELKVLSLAANRFSGEVPPGIGDCVSLERLSLGTNGLTGLSKGLFRLRKLLDLNLADNELSGPLSRGIGNLTNLVRLDISTNGLSGAIPNVFHELRKLESFIAHSNRFEGNIPDSLSNSPTLSTLNLRNNSLVGTISLNCSAMVNIKTLSLARNRFSGLIPDNLPYCRRLKSVGLSRNEFTGKLPESFGDFHSLSHLSLSKTTNVNLSSALRILHRCRNLTTLGLSMTFLDDKLPSDPDLQFERLEILAIANCRLSGSVPQWLSRSKSLRLLDLSWNRLVGTIPRWLGCFELLFYLDLSNNSFTGEIPKTLTESPTLVSRDVSIEEPLPDFPFFMKRNVSARRLQYNHLWSFPPTLDLSRNNLSGPVWAEFGNLRKLHVLDLKFNNLSGPIPSQLSGMVNLESLDLSHNRLSGTIPSALARLTFLSKFSVAYNKLHGPIPTGTQFLTFPSSSFQGNDLCGLTTESLCEPSESGLREPTASDESSSSEDFVYAIGLGMGVGTAFGLVFGAVLFQVLSTKYGMFKILRSSNKKPCYKIYILS